MNDTALKLFGGRNIAPADIENNGAITKLVSWPVQLDTGPGNVITFSATSETERLYMDAPVALAFVDRDLRYRHVNRRMAEINAVPSKRISAGR